MPSLLKLTVISCAVAVANARWFKGSDDAQSSWSPAKETLGATRVEVAGWTPKPTGLSKGEIVENELRKRAVTNTCGYYTGYSSSAAVVCINSASCVVNSRDMAMGCCNAVDVASCNVVTSCIERASSSLWTSGQAYTILCSSAAFPFCVTYSYAGPSSWYSGFRAFGCGDTKTQYTVQYLAPADTSSLSSSRTSSSSESSSTRSSSSTTTSSSTLTSSATQSATTTAESQAAAGTPIGPIVGGVVGGVGAIALIALVAFFLIRRSKNNKDAGPPPAALQQQPTGPYSPGGGPQQFGNTPPPMTQTPQQYGAYPVAGFAATDHRSSIAPSYYPQSPKSQYETSTMGVSPNPTGQQQYGTESHYSNSPYSPTPPSIQQQPAYNAYNPAQPPPQQYQAYQPQQQQPHNSHAAELPIERGDRELRELA